MRKDILSPRPRSLFSHFCEPGSFSFTASISEHLFRLPVHRDENRGANEVWIDSECMENIERPARAFESRLAGIGFGLGYRWATRGFFILNPWVSIGFCRTVALRRGRGS